MANYVYKITNNLNGKFYIGKRSHKDPNNDSYMGSGKLISQSIKIYGKENFTKEILGVFPTNNEASEFERSIVTKHLVANNMCYNMHEGGHGGFAHINNLPVEERINIISLRTKIASGEVSVGGDKTQYYTESTYEKLKIASKKGNDKLKLLRETNPEYFIEANKKLSIQQTLNNGMKDRIWIEKDSIRKVIHKDEYNSYKIDGWISSKEKTVSNVQKMKRRWINNGIINKLPKCEEYQEYLNSGWNPGRISIEINN